jgi:hypothetical protein
MHRAAKQYPQESFLPLKSFDRLTAPNSAPSGFEGMSWKRAGTLLLALLLGVSASPALGQRSAGGHPGGGSRSTGGGGFHPSAPQTTGGRSASTDSRPALVAGPAKSAPVRSSWVDPPPTRVGVESETAIASSSGPTVETRTSRAVPTEGGRVSDRTSSIGPDAHPRDVTIGFPLRSPRDPRFSPTRPGVGATRPNNARDIGDRRAVSPLYLFGPRHKRHRHPPFFGNLGFFGSDFGIPFFGFDLFSDCTSFWDGTLPSDCNTVEYWNGYGGGLDLSYDQGYETGDQVQPNDQQEPGGSQDWNSNVYRTPPAPSTGAQSQSVAPLTVLWLKGGTSFAVTDYWLAGDQLHYQTSYGGQNAIAIDELDLQKTVNANASPGAGFVLRPGPQGGPSNPQLPQP